MSDLAEVRRRTFQAAREIAHAATALASEAAGLARIYERHGSLEPSISASHASINAAHAAFRLDASSREDGDLKAALADAGAALDAAEEAIRCARRALASIVAGVAEATRADG